MVLTPAPRPKTRVAALKLAAAFALAAALAGAVLETSAEAQQLSPGCDAINTQPLLDGIYPSVAGFNLNVFAGERLTVSAVAVPSSTATGFTLVVNGTEVDTVNLPGTTTYTFPSSATFFVLWQSLPLPPQNVNWTVSCAAPVAASFRGLSATNTKRGVLVRWRTASEVDALGFNVYRAVQGKRVRVNARMIPAHGVGAYSFLDRAAPRAKSLRYWIQLVNLDGSRSWYGPARLALP